jgi:5-methylcytosine-specific restriction endonuclease McrA
MQAMDHLLPMNAGGGTTAMNCVPTCTTCNARKGSTLPNRTRTAERILQLQHILRRLFEKEGTDEHVGEVM